MLYDIILQHPVLALVIFLTVIFALFCENHREIPIIALCILLCIAFLVNENDKEKVEFKDACYRVDWDYVIVRDDANGKKWPIRKRSNSKINCRKISVDGMASTYDVWLEIYPRGKWVTKHALIKVE